MKGYKGFDKELKCRNFQYEVGQTYETDRSISLCNYGFHYCNKLWDVNEYYIFADESFRFCEIEALGEIQEEGNKSVTNKIKIIREIPREEFMELVNTGNGNTGFLNTGDWNTGDSNTGDWNTGDSNTGDWNTGNSNTGNRNTGDWNTGYRNTTNRSAGVFCTEEPKMIMFNKTTDMTFDEWRNTRAYDILLNVGKSKWIYFSQMTKKEKTKFPSAEACDGYFKELPRNETSEEWWSNLDNFDKLEIFNLPNFDLKVFNEIMELKINKEEYNQVIKNANN